MSQRTLEERIQRLEDIHEIMNIMGKYPYYVLASKQDEINKWFSKDPGTRVYFGEKGYWEGSDAPTRAAGSAPRIDFGEDDRRIGNLQLHAPICPVIEIAGDGRTAKGTWIGIGILGRKDRKTGKPAGGWEFDKYGVDFIKEDGRWKIWHYHIYRLIHQLDWDDKWEDQFAKEDTPIPGMTPDGHSADDYPYRLDTVQPLIPKPPEPFKTWSDTTSY